jgi:hypothetical protein
VRLSAIETEQEKKQEVSSMITKRSSIASWLFRVLPAAAMLLLSCDGGNLPEGLGPTPAGDGPIIKYDLYHKPLPEVPLPTDLAARPDPDAPTGMRLNVSQHADTTMESLVRRQLDSLDGWGTFAPISLSFECKGDRDGVCLDLDNVMRRHWQDGYPYGDDAIYLVSLQEKIPDPETGEPVPNPDYGKPVPLDIGEGNFPLYLVRDGYYYQNDPRSTSPTTFFESVNEARGEDLDCDGRLDTDEDVNGNRVLDAGEDLDGDGWLDLDEDTNDNGRLERSAMLDQDPSLCVSNDLYDPAFDTNFDGVMGRANVWCSAEKYRRGECHCLGNRECPKNLDADDPRDIEKLSYLLDPFWHTIYFYELATNTISLRPLIPMREQSRYAVIVTDRLVGEDGKPVRSPFPTINHVEQTDALAALPGILGSAGDTFGDLQMRNVRFVWSFTTQTVTKDLQELRRGLYGYGKFKDLAEEFPAKLYVNRTWACNPIMASCNEAEDLTEDQNTHHFIVRTEDLMRVILYYADEIFDLSPQEIGGILDLYDYVDYFVFGHFWSPNLLDTNGDGVEAYRYMNEDVDGDGKLEYTEDDNCNGLLDPGEDRDGDGELDTSEDDNKNLLLDPGEDKDGDGHLDRNEDLDGDCQLDTVTADEGYWNVNTRTGEEHHSGHQVPFLLVVPKEEMKIKGMEDKPFPVVFYGHGYTSMTIEALGFAGTHAKWGLATMAIDCVHHGLGEGDIGRVEVGSVFEVENLTGIKHGLLDDRTVDMNGDGFLESAGDFWTAYLFHTRDVVRQSALDHYNLIRSLRSFDGTALAGPSDVNGDGEPDASWDFINWTDDPGSEYYEMVGDYNGDGRLDIAGDFDGDGDVDIGGPDSWYFAWGQSLGGIMSALMGGADPAIRAVAPTSGGGGLGDIALRTKQGGVKEAVLLRSMGPILNSNPVSAGMVENGQTVCDEGDLSLAFTVPDLNDDADVEFACACFGDNDCPDRPAYLDHVDMAGEYDSKPIHLRAGDGVALINVAKNERHCTIVGKAGEVRISFPSDLLDRVDVAVYDGSDIVPFTDFETCEPARDGLLKDYIRTWRRSQTFQFWDWSMARRDGDALDYAPVGEPLVSPAEGYGIAKNTPDFRKFLSIAQIILEPGDPINYAPHYFLDPLRYPEEDAVLGTNLRTNACVIGTVGDMNVPVNTAAAQGRAAGIIDLFDTDTPYGKSYNEVFLDNYMVEGIYRNHRTYPDDASDRCTEEAAPDGCPILFDVDDLDRDCDGKASPYLKRPARLWVPSDPTDWDACVEAGTDADTGYTRWQCGRCELLTSSVSAPPARPSREDGCRAGDFVERATCPGGISLMMWPYLNPEGEHGFNIPAPCNAFDIDMFMANFISYYFRTGGTSISYEMCMQLQPRVDAMDPTGSYYMFCPFENMWTCPACPNRACDPDWYAANHPASCPASWDDIPENEHELLPDYYTTVCVPEETP